MDTALSTLPVKYMTMWGTDPIWGSNPLDFVSPDVTDFNNRISTGTYTLPEASFPAGIQFTVVGHAVHFDITRNLWYCDISVNPHNTYFPFIRLALVRYQPHSIIGAHLSPVVLADFAQLSPDRTASITRNAAKPNELKVGVTGVSLY